MTLLCSAYVALALAGTDLGPQWFQANTAYEQEEYAQAVELYESLVRTEPNSAHLWYNLGNSYLRKGRVGEAIAAYLRSEGIAPRDPDTLANLAFARKSARDDIKTPEPAPLLRTLVFWHYTLSKAELGWVVLTANLFFWLLLGMRLWGSQSEVRLWIQGLVLLILLLSGGSLLIRTVVPSHIAVVKGREIAVHSGTSRSTVVQFKLHAGTETTWVEKRDAWIRILVDKDKQGWVHSDDVIPFKR